MGSVTWTKGAIEELRGIHEYLATDSPTVAVRLVAQLLESAERLREFPHSGRVIPRMEGMGIREIIVRPYRIAYRVVGGDARILKVHHGARLLRRRDFEANE